MGWRSHHREGVTMESTETVLAGRGLSTSSFAGSQALARIVSWTAYPAVMTGGLGLHLLLARGGMVPPASGPAAIAVGLLAIVLLEAWWPYRPGWRAERRELLTDAIYLAAVQALLPAALALAVGAALSGEAPGRIAAVRSLWPHEWPIALQFLLMLALADLAKYGLHAAAHRYGWLWRFHAVHHAPPKLYALTVARFHPLERTAQYLLETLPFALVGADGQVLALYLVFHSLHGFFQHANVDVRLGWLNYLVSGPELHRWHHSRMPAESNGNYANHLAVWDLAFSTYRWPAGHVGALGLQDDRFPAGFAGQLVAPFVGARDRAARAPGGWRDAGVNLLMRVQMAVLRWTAWRPLAAAARRPREVQLSLLRRIVSANRDTEFGREHGFASIRTYEDYCRHVPVQTYESLRPYIDAQERTRRRCLTAEPPVLYAQTSGTTGTPKHLPLTRTALALQQRSQRLFSFLQHRAVPGAYAGRLLAIVSPAVEGYLPGGSPFGSASGHLHASMPRLLRRKYVVPPEVFAVEDYALRYLLILRLALAERDITAMGAANPSTFLQLLTTLTSHRAELLSDLEHEGFSRAAELSPAVQRAIAPRLGCGPARQEELRSLLARDPSGFAELWPHLRLVATWTGGSCGIALARLRAALPPATEIVELGYLASELRGSVTLGGAPGLGVPTLRETFFEFVEPRRWEEGDPTFFTLDQLEVGRDYYVCVTTVAGLYRYFMNDIVRVTGRFQATPTIAFLQKGKGVTSITGEKLYESQAIDAVRAAEHELGASSRFFLMLADVERARYRLVMETDRSFAPDPGAFAARVDCLLGERNLEYRQKRASGRLGPLVMTAMGAGFADAFKQWCVARGQREGQFKTIALQYLSDLPFDYDAYRAAARAEAG
jgi:sterol desaturase/sphingolipid hydroxylase (fatty acid hydroxylase superfamily)